MVNLAVFGGEAPLSLALVAQREGISLNYLEQVAAMLRKAGLVRSVKGAQGGYRLAESPDRLTVGRILRALEGDLSILDEADLVPTPDESPIHRCLRLRVWEPLNDVLSDLADQTTLEDLAARYRTLAGIDPLVYQI